MKDEQYKCFRKRWYNYAGSKYDLIWSPTLVLKSERVPNYPELRERVQQFARLILKRKEGLYT